MQNFIEFELINNWAMLSFVFSDHTHPAYDVTICTESAIYIWQIFANNLKTKGDSVLQ